jgi:hypothetical protein
MTPRARPVRECVDDAWQRVVTCISHVRDLPPTGGTGRDADERRDDPHPGFRERNAESLGESARKLSEGPSVA